MSFYSAVLFVHIVGALTLFMTFAIEWTSLRQLWRAATLDHARTWGKVLTGVRRLSIVAMLAIILAGMYLARRMEAWQEAWVWAGLVGTFLIAGIAVALTQRRMREIRQASDGESPEVTGALAIKLRDPLLRVSLHLRTAMALGIVFLMTTKPNLGGALLTLGVIAVVGIFPTLLERGRHQAGDPSTETARFSE